MNFIDNHHLFSDKYLETVNDQLRHDPDPTTKSLYFQTKKLYDLIYPIAPNLVEAQIERDLIRPLLKLFDHHFVVQPTLRTSQGIRRPDYVFFASESALNSAKSKINTDDLFKTAIAVGDAKSWSRNLDRKFTENGDPFNNANPSYQIDFYLRETDQIWGILTNGRQWRLYHRKISYRLDSFYQFDLEKLFSQNDNSETDQINAFRIFHAFFHRSAFVKDLDGKCFLDHVFEESRQHTVNVSEDLADRVQKALKVMISGFLDLPRNKLETDQIQTIYENSLVLLYRILFVLNAESRGLLPIGNPDYAIDHSLSSIAADAHKRRSDRRYIIPTMCDFWTRLHDLFGLINDGWKELIPQYNGGLFDPKRYSFLERNLIGNASLIEALDLVAYTKNGERIAYESLDVRHLCRVYHSLLKSAPKLADAKITIQSDQKRKLSIDPREIVEKTLSPLVQNRSPEQILKLKILDLAIGGGLFLIEAVDFLAEQISTRPNGGIDESISEIAYWRRRVVEACIYGVDRDPMAVELAKLSLWLHTVTDGEPLAFLDHHLRCGNSILGAKLDDLPNLPIGPKKIKSKSIESQTELHFTFDLTESIAIAIRNYLQIEALPNHHASHADLKEQKLINAISILRPYKTIADLWMSCYFGAEIDPQNYRSFIRDAQSKNRDDLITQINARKLARSHHFFHWEIEFPEIFRNIDGEIRSDAGFSAIVGHLPITAEKLEIDRKFLANFKVHKSRTHPTAYLVERANDLLQNGGHLGLIIPDRLLRLRSAEKFRNYLETEMTLIDLKLCGSEVGIFAKRSKPKKSRVKISDLQKRDANFTTLGYFCDDQIYRGMITGCNSALIVSLKQRSEFITADPKSAEILKPIISTSSTQNDQFYLIDATSDFELEKYSAISDHLKKFEVRLKRRRSKTDEWWQLPIQSHDSDQPKIFCRERLSGDDQFFDLDLDGILCTNSFYFIPRIDFYLLAILNSEAIREHLRSVCPNSKNGRIRLTKRDLSEIPIREIVATTDSLERKRLLKKAEILFDHSHQNGDDSGLINFAENQFSENRLGVLRDLLAFLSEENYRSRSDLSKQIIDQIVTKLYSEYNN